MYPQPMETKPITVFYSYAHKDERYRLRLETCLSTLKRQGLIVTWHDRNISVGTEWAHEINTHLNSADLILLLISPDFIASDYCYSIEAQRAMERHHAGEARVIPILLRPTDWKGVPFARLQALPSQAKPVTKWQPQDDAFLDITRGIRAIIEDLVSTPSASTSATASFPSIWMISSCRNPFFTGREDLLTHLHEQLTKAKEPQAISGLGGIGKTQLAIEYAYRHCTEYHYVLWLRASTRNTLNFHLRTLAAVLHLSEKYDPNLDKVIVAVKQWLSTHDKWLLIGDDIDDLTMITDFLPSRSTGHVLLLTCAQSTGNIARQLNLEKMNLEEGIHLLLMRAKMLAPGGSLDQVDSKTRATAGAIVDEVDALPLALDQAGAYIEETKCSLQRYLTLYRKYHQYFLRQRGNPAIDHPNSVTTTLLLSFKRIKQANRLAADILSLCVFLDPNTIDENVLRADIRSHGFRWIARFASYPEVQIDNALRDLLRYSLIHRTEKGTLSIHRLVQIVLQDEMSQKTQRQWAERAVRAVNQVFSFTSTDTPHQLDNLHLLPDEMVGAAMADDHGIRFSIAASLLAHKGFLLQKYVQQAEPRLRRVLEKNADIQEQGQPLPTDEKATTTTTKGKGKKKLIMIIDESLPVRKIIETSLRREGLEAVGYEDGVQAMRALADGRQTVPDLVILDIGLPKMDGYEIARRFKSKPEFAHTTIIMLTGRDGVIDRLKSRHSGAKDFITKPFKTRDVISLVQSHLGILSDHQDGINL